MTILVLKHDKPGQFSSEPEHNSGHKIVFKNCQNRECFAEDVLSLGNVWVTFDYCSLYKIYLLLTYLLILRGNYVHFIILQQFTSNP